MIVIFKILNIAGLAVNRLHSTSLSTMSRQSDCFEANDIKLEAKVSHNHNMEVGYMLLLWSPGCGNLDKNKNGGERQFMIEIMLLSP